MWGVLLAVFNYECNAPGVSGPDNAWTPEVRLSDGSGGNKYPAIDVPGSTVIPVVVWQRDNGFTGDILLRRKSGGMWQSEQIVTSLSVHHR